MRTHRKLSQLAAATLLALAIFPGLAYAHGAEPEEVQVEEGPAAGAAPNGTEGTEGHSEVLIKQPARILAQQAISLLLVLGDTEEATFRLDSAVESEDKTNVDPQLLEQAMETLDAGNEVEAISLLDQALSKPVGEESGAVLHDSGREFQPATGAQEIVGIVLGAAALVLATFILLRGRRTRASAP